MQTWTTKLAVGTFALAVLSLTSCNKDETRTMLTVNTMPTLKASTTTPDLGLTTANSGTSAATFTYTAADFGYQAGVTYTLQFDKKGGTFASPVTYAGGITAGTVSLTTAQLVNVFTSLGYAFNATSQVDVRVVASVGADAPLAASSVITLTGKPTPLCIANTYGNWSIIGPAADGWSADRMLTYDCYTQTFTLRSALNAGDFKFRVNQDWTTNLGGTATTYTTGVPLSLNGSNLTLATAGTYTITLSLTTNATGGITGGNVTVKP